MAATIFEYDKLVGINSIREDMVFLNSAGSLITYPQNSRPNDEWQYIIKRILGGKPVYLHKTGSIKYSYGALEFSEHKEELASITPAAMQEIYDIIGPPPSDGFSSVHALIEGSNGSKPLLMLFVRDIAFPDMMFVKSRRSLIDLKSIYGTSIQFTYKDVIYGQIDENDFLDIYAPRDPPIYKIYDPDTKQFTGDKVLSEVLAK